MANEKAERVATNWRPGPEVLLVKRDAPQTHEGDLELPVPKIKHTGTVLRVGAGCENKEGDRVIVVPYSAVILDEVDKDDATDEYLIVDQRAIKATLDPQ